MAIADSNSLPLSIHIELTIQIASINSYESDIEPGLLLPISRIESRSQLKMAELYEDIEDDGKWSNSLLGYRPFEE